MYEQEREEDMEVSRTKLSDGARSVGTGASGKALHGFVCMYREESLHGRFMCRS